MADKDPAQPSPQADYFNATALMVVVTSTLALYNSLELLLLIFTTFKRYAGLYFWSLLVASAGVMPYSLGYLVVYFELSYNWLGVAIDTIGWVMMISGQSVVLYSRLHLVLHNRKVLRGVLWMIVFNGILWHTLTTIINYGATYSKAAVTFTAVYVVVEKVQMTCFCTQEFIISGVYLYETVRLLKVVSNGNTRSIMWQLFVINVIIVLMDVGLLALEYRDQRALEQTFKAAIYSVKLKLEFAILGKLVSVIGTTRDKHLSDAIDRMEDIVDSARTASDVTHASPTKTTSGPYWPREELNKEVSSEYIETIAEGSPDRKKVNRHTVNERPEEHSLSAPLRARSSTDPGRSNSEDTYADFIQQISRA
jgi:hypothetical protein